MDSLFGLSMNTVMYVLLAVLAVQLLVVAVIFLRNRIVFLMGLRNIPRRVAQTVLIVVGLMLSTVIITAAFTTGDTVDYSITKQTYDLLRHADIILDGEVGGTVPGAVPGEDTNSNISGEDYRAFLEAADAAGLENVDGYTGILIEPVPVVNPRTQLSEPDVTFAGLDAERMDAFPDIIDIDSGDVLDINSLAPGEVYLNESAADELDAKKGDVLDVYVQGQKHVYAVAAIVEDTAAGGAVDFSSSEGMSLPLSDLQDRFSEDEVTVVVVSAAGGVRDTLDVVTAAQTEIDEIVGENNLRMEVSDTKVDLVDDAEEIGNFMTTFFLVLGLFSIGAGMLLVVMIFVMLAAERKSEMGMARAVGMKRSDLVQMFISEGSVYDIGSAFVGLFIGILVAFALTTAASNIFESFGFSFTPHATLRTAVVSFCLGAVLTFLTVTFSSARISNLNIVAAIRDTDDAQRRDPEAGTMRAYLRSLMNAFVAFMFPLGTLTFAVRGQNFASPEEDRYPERPQPWFPLLHGVIGFPFYQAAMVITGRRRVPSWPFYFPIMSAPYLVCIAMFRILRDHRPQSVPSIVNLIGIVLPFPVGFVLVALQQPKQRVIWAPGVWTVLAVIGVLLVWMGVDGDSAFPFALGFSLTIGGAAVVATYFGAPPRPAYTAMGVLLLVFWGLTAGNRLEWLFGTLDGDVEMFFLSGVAMVTASTFVLIYNGDILLGGLERVGGMFGSILPSLRTAIAYPMANRFRTGMTLAMISLVVFALTTMSAMNLNYDKLFLQDESRGGWDVQVIENPNNPLSSLGGALVQANSRDVAEEIRGEGSVLVAGFDSATEVTQDGENYDDYPVRGLTDGFIENGSVPLDLIANGYDSEEAVWQTLRTDPDTAVVDRFTIESGFGEGEFQIEGIETTDETFDPVAITIRDATTGASREVEIIGIIAFGASSNFFGIYIGADAFTETFGEPELAIHFAALEDPDNASNVAKRIEAALVTSGAQADSLKELAEENNALSRNFLYLMQAFMGLGLVVGIAAIGVIAFRTVVERRQQIGMLRAIGYKKGQVSLSFLMESSFVTILGVASGTGLGLWLAYFLVTSDDFPGDGGTFYIPWAQILFFSVVTIVASFLMTWIPARQAASVPTAEALRYE